MWGEVAVAGLFAAGSGLHSLGDVDADRLRLRCDEVFVIQLVAGPQRPARDEVEVLGAADGFVVVAERGAEDAALAVLVGPDADLVVALLLVLGGAERVGVRPELLDPIEFPGWIGPGGAELGHDRMAGVDVQHLMRIGRPVPPRGHAAELEPVIGPVAVAVHRTVQHDGWQPLAVRRDDILGPGVLLHVGETLVVNDDIEPLRPVLLLVQRDSAGGRRAALVDDHHVHVGPFHHPLREQFLLRVVVVAAPAADQQHLERLRRFRGPDE